MFTNKSILISTTIGNALELFDFITFAFLSPIIAMLFFPKSIHALAIIYTYSMITISYLLRPIGGAVLGHLSDKYGRKSVFVISMLMMAIPSLVIACMPTFATIGYVATGIILLSRMAQGFSLGSEVPVSITYIFEQFKHKNYILFCSMITFGANIGICMGLALLFVLLNHHSDHFIYSIGWRIPFLFGSTLGVIGFYVRSNITESPEFLLLKKHHDLCNSPFWITFTKYKRQILCGMLIVAGSSITTSVFQIFMPSLLFTYFNIPLTVTNVMSLYEGMVIALCSVLFAYLTQYISYIAWIRISLLSLISILIITLFIKLDIASIFLYHKQILYIWLTLIALSLSIINGIFFGALAQLFPTKIRVSGIAMSYNVSYLFGAGLCPLWTSAILSYSHNVKYIFMVCIIIYAIALINTKFINNLTTTD